MTLVYFDPHLYIEWIDVHTPEVNDSERNRRGLYNACANDDGRISDRAFDRVDNGEYQLRVSEILLMQVYHVLTLTYKSDRRDKCVHRHSEEELYGAVVTKYNELVDYLLSLGSDRIKYSNSGFERGYEDSAVGLALWHLEHLHLPDLSELPLHRGRRVQTLDIIVPKIVDYLHLQIAMNTGCDMFITCNKAVLNLNGYLGDMEIVMP